MKSSVRTVALIAAIAAGGAVAAPRGDDAVARRMQEVCRPALAAHPGPILPPKVVKRRAEIRHLVIKARRSGNPYFLNSIASRQVALVREESVYLSCHALDPAADYERSLRCSELDREFGELEAGREMNVEKGIIGLLAEDCRVLRDFGKLELGLPLSFSGRFSGEASSSVLFATFHGASFGNILFKDVDLRHSDFTDAKCEGECFFYRVDAEGVDFSRADLGRARFVGGSVRNAGFAGAHLGGMLFEPDPRGLPDLAAMSTASGLSEMRWESSPIAIRRLRDAFKREGYREAWIQVNYAYRDSRPGVWSSSTVGAVEYAFGKVLFGLTAGYGLYPGRPLMILAAMIPLFALLYLFGLRSQGAGGGIWAIWPKERVDPGEGSADPLRLSLSMPFPPGAERPTSRPVAMLAAGVRVILLALTAACAVAALVGFIDIRFFASQMGRLINWVYSDTVIWMTTELDMSSVFVLLTAALLLSLVSLPLQRWREAWRSAFYFSLLSAFHFGWRDLNVGSWLQRIQPREYGLRATGWVRVVSGLQSLLSVFLIALWAITYFGGALE
jgi:hypothetical protein